MSFSAENNTAQKIDRLVYFWWLIYTTVLLHAIILYLAGWQCYSMVSAFIWSADIKDKSICTISFMLLFRSYWRHSEIWNSNNFFCTFNMINPSYIYTEGGCSMFVECIWEYSNPSISQPCFTTYFETTLDSKTAWFGPKGQFSVLNDLILRPPAI